MRLILVRHGESVGNSENRLQGHNDYPLTELGQQQAMLTARRLAEIGTSALYSSPLLRAGDTARAISDVIGREMELLPDVSEYHFGEVSGATYAELRQRFANDPVWQAKPAAERVYPGEEGRDNFYARVTNSIWRVIDQHPGRPSRSSLTAGLLRCSARASSACPTSAQCPSQSTTAPSR